MAASALVALLLVAVAVANAQQAYQTSALNKHNSLRAKHRDTPAMAMDNNLNDLAVKCANYYAQKKAIDHSCPHKNGAGENLVGGSGTWTAQQFADMGTQMWYDEIKAYDYNKPGFSMATGHFTQVVWKTSTKFGFGHATIGGFTAGVGLYLVHGNMQGQFPQNVMPLK